MGPSGRSRATATAGCARTAVSAGTTQRLALIRGLEPFGYRDAFRALHPADTDEISWGWARWDGGYRLDHLIVSSLVAVEECRYLHGWREEGLSDHSPLLATLGLAEQIACCRRPTPPAQRPDAVG